MRVLSAFVTWSPHPPQWGGTESSPSRDGSECPRSPLRYDPALQGGQDEEEIKGIQLGRKK